MGIWEYRVYKEDGCYTFREHHSQEDGDISYTTRPAYPMALDDDEGGPLESLRWQNQMMMKALEKPVI
ncbi:MAG TPA: hypothetical protein VFO10_19500 [Oligoflexus sp.]|uniref:hypothetical protein n=1 Tax=Oligoflexus sp. TaxID=1971216 RepID=UPI002D807268|nr:hypothetical protein [Oligoflexus sp.]HET9239457.1 hypothetical protein [Oligoflexus sp.]